LFQTTSPVLAFKRHELRVERAEEHLVADIAPRPG
jgi:hypothetical protein